MGILNVTPDSVSDGGQFVSVEVVVTHACLMISKGADMIDIGAQSTRPMAFRISTEEELDRLMPVLEAVVVYCTSRCLGWANIVQVSFIKKSFCFIFFASTQVTVREKRREFCFLLGKQDRENR